MDQEQVHRGLLHLGAPTKWPHSSAAESFMATDTIHVLSDGSGAAACGEYGAAELNARPCAAAAAAALRSAVAAPPGSRHRVHLVLPELVSEL